MQFARKRLTRTAAAALTGVLLLTACGSDDGDDVGGDPTSDDGSEAEGSALAPAEGCETINVGTIGWTEDVAVNALFGHVLGERGWDWDTENLEVGALYSGVASGDLDLFMDAWLPFTHSDYWEQFGDDITELTTWYQQAPLTWVVPTYVADNEGVTSIADLVGKGDTFDGQIVGIEAGAGLTRVSREDVIPTYELGDEYELVESSTPAMLSALGDAIENEEPIVVTLWEPHSAYAKWELTNLEDPEGALGEPDEIRAISANGFAERCPNAAAVLQNFTISGEALADLELKIEEAGEGNDTEGVEAWLAENQDTVDEWLSAA